MKNYKTMVSVAAAGLALSAGSSYAQMISSGTLDQSISAVYGGAAGTATFSINPAFNTPPQSGNLMSAVYLPGSGLTDPSGYTGITFAFQVNETGSDFIDHISLDGFNLSSVYVEYANSGFVAPFQDSFSGGVLSIDFNPTVQSGSKSDLIYVFTTAASYSGNTATVDDGTSANTTDLAPVPETNTVVAGALMLLPLGIGAVRALRKERTA